mmetsp:Transcript_20016/g.49164  ORF Transcript_20016/g.49164 Transcript_20016/m.49164 type:complete len:151 (+) Transcript_20016:135-587(+)|eukprot:CAMPEP_0206275060 /NCGR_PEP_ID=MMETSP0047_2-20121206/35512_1 /ASSEMBLY_ACC=CAM_ASM_000192 /TAXON_ID=195065 /ORGANISM="Chroomonas mesostigmatica_cf, Strain CCMP1168" /LENGTH=150 /DNA_ID=CAMNT_0053704367 /DNA_START=125 /DNA_END=577 /DNA_ORIENTATION=+
MTYLKTAITFILAFVFLMAGGNKITDAIHKETHDTLAGDMKSTFGPFWKKIAVDAKLPADAVKVLIDDDGTYKTFLRNIGIVEVFCVVLLFSPMRTLSAGVLALIMAAATYMHFALADNKAPVTGVLLAFCILVMLPSQKPAPKIKAKRG